MHRRNEFWEWSLASKMNTWMVCQWLQLLALRLVTLLAIIPNFELDKEPGTGIGCTEENMRPANTRTKGVLSLRKRRVRHVDVLHKLSHVKTFSAEVCKIRRPTGFGESYNLPRF